MTATVIQAASMQCAKLQSCAAVVIGCVFAVGLTVCCGDLTE